MNQGETDIDRGGPCELLDSRALAPSATLWARSFRVRDGSYNAMAYVQNPNEGAGVRSISYRFGLYDSQNVLIAERTGSTYLIPGGITPVFESAINAGNRVVTHTYFEFTQAPLWERMKSGSDAITIDNKTVSNVSDMPRLSAVAKNNSVKRFSDLTFAAVVFDPAGNAFAASETSVPGIAAGDTLALTFTWPDPFPAAVGRVDIITLVPPAFVSGK